MIDRSLPDRVMVAVRKSGASLSQDEVWAKVREAVSRGLTDHEEIAGFVLDTDNSKGRIARSDTASVRSAR